MRIPLLRIPLMTTLRLKLNTNLPHRLPIQPPHQTPPSNATPKPSIILPVKPTQPQSRHLTTSIPRKKRKHYPEHIS